MSCQSQSIINFGGFFFHHQIQVKNLPAAGWARSQNGKEWRSSSEEAACAGEGGSWWAGNLSGGFTGIFDGDLNGDLMGF